MRDTEIPTVKRGADRAARKRLVEAVGELLSWLDADAAEIDSVLAEAMQAAAAREGAALSESGVGNSIEKKCGLARLPEVEAR
ncbi:MAG: hypothetical protein HS116_05220 [Planctomycetes bacterium]|nr:hypothetical protein [Planctomycetota bacterium]